jgi:ribosome maturation factor RimP
VDTQDSRPEGKPSAVQGGLQQAIDRIATGLGYELVDVERAARGLLQVFIDRVPGHVYPSGEGEFVTVEDCELVSRQLQYALEVDGIDYERLEVSSPGLDRPLKREADYVRFAGQQVNLRLKAPLKGRKGYRGLLTRCDSGWRLELEGKDGEESSQALDFTLDEVRDARLVPVVDFKGRRPAPAAGAETDKSGAPAASQEQAGMDGGQDR